MYGYQNGYNPYMNTSQQQYGYPQNNMNPYNNPQYQMNNMYNNNMNRSIQQNPNQNMYQPNSQNMMYNNPYSNNTVTINPIIASRMNRQTSNPVGGSGNNQNQMNRNIYASQNNVNPMFNQNQMGNNSMSNNQSIFSNNNNNNNLSIQNVFNQPNSNSSNQTQSIFGNAPNLLDVINFMPSTSIFDPQSSVVKYIPKIRLGNIMAQRNANNPFYTLGNNNQMPLCNNKLVLPPPKRLQVKRVSNTFIDQKGDLSHDQKQFLNDRLIRPQSTKSFFSEKKPTGILKNSNMIINLRRNSEDLQLSNSGNGAEQKRINNLNNSLLNMEEEKKKKQQIKELFPSLYNQNRFWNDLKSQSLNKQEQNVKKKYQFLYEMEQDPNSEFYLPRRKALMEEQMRQRGIQLQQEAQENGNFPFDKDRKHIEEFETEEEVEQERQFYREYLDSHNDGLMDLNVLARCTKKLLDLEKWKEELAKQRKYEKFGFGLFKYEMKREFAFVSIICHVTNISTQKSEEIDQLQKVQFKLTDTIQQIISDHYQKHILKSGLIWHRDYDELIGKNATYIDTDGKIVALTPIEKSLKDFKVANKGKIIIEIFVSEAPVLKNDKYKCSPTIYEMRHWPIEELQSVSSFTIQNQYGKIEFENPVEITRQDLDKIVIIEQQRAIVYPEHLYSGKCPKVGCKLNQQAVVTLYCIDKKAFEEHRQKTIDYEKLERKLRRQCEKNKCEFVNFDRKKFWFSFRVFDWSC
ncbi:hypothetical protein ABPG74_001421 [Tetrahymena malaccensis]